MNGEKRSDRGEIWVSASRVDAEGRARRFFRPNRVKRAYSCKVPGEGVSNPPPPFSSCCAPMKCTEAFGPFIHRMNTKSEEQNIRMLLNARLDD